MVLEKTLHLVSIMIRGMVDEENDTLNIVSSRVCNEITKVTAKLDVSPSGKCVPYNAFARPEQGDKAVYAFGVTKRFNVSRLSSPRPASLDFWEEFSPFLVLEANEDFFLNSAGAMRL